MGFSHWWISVQYLLKKLFPLCITTWISINCLKNHISISQLNSKNIPDGLILQLTELSGCFILFSMSFMVVHKRWWSEVTYANHITLVSQTNFLKCLRVSMVNAIVISATEESPRGMVPVMMRLLTLQKWIMSFLLLWLISPVPWALIIPTS